MKLVYILKRHVQAIHSEGIQFLGFDLFQNNRLSFVGHSLGGLIIRTALPYLEEYAEKMYSYMSLSTPHFGYMYNASKIIEAGIYYFIHLVKF